MKKYVLLIEKSQSYHHPTSANELLAFFGLLYLTRMEKNSHRNLDELWSVRFDSSANRATMNLNRFSFLAKCLRFGRKKEKLLINLNPFVCGINLCGTCL